MKKYFLIIFMFLGMAVNALAQEELTITGTVVDETGEPLIGASITVKDAAGLGAITNVDGEYKIKVKQFQTLQYTYVGYLPQEIIVKGDKTVINVTMKEEAVNALDDVVVTGMGTQKKLTVTGAITNVDMGDLKHFSTSNLTNTLAGNVPGIMAYQSSGQPGKNTSEFWIRGISTFGAGTSAYILVDGFERDNIDDIAIEDIATFSVLKDASATAIYGSKGANGVVLITTKRGKAGKIQVSGKFETSYNTRTITPEFVSGEEYANYINEARITRNYGVLYQPVEIELIKSGLDPDLYPNVNWQDLLLKDGAMSYRASVNLQGGGETARYFVSAAYTEDEGMYKTDETLRKDYDTNANYRKWSYRANLDIDITKTTILKVGVAGNLNKRNSPGLGDDKVWGEMFGYNALSQPVRYSNGYIPTHQDTWFDPNNGDWTGVNYLNPWVASTQTGYNNDWENIIQSNVTLEQDLGFITKGLKFVGRFGYDTYNSNSINHLRMPALYTANKRDSETGEVIYDKKMDAIEMYQRSSNSGSRNEFLDATLSWNNSFLQAHNFGATVRFSQDSKISTQNLGTDIKNSVSRKNTALAAQATYNYKNRYFFDYNFGYNGSENFADGHRWGFFPAYSLAWNVAEEPFVQKIAPWMDMFKIRYSHGKVGNDQMYEGGSQIRFPYLYTLGYVSGTQYNWSQGSYSTNYAYQGIHYTQLASNGVTWEVARKDDLGIDLVLFRNKFTLTADYFYEKRTGIYMTRNFLPAITGLESAPKANVGATTNKGIDGNFKYEDQFGDVHLIVRGNMTYSKGKILEYDEENSVYPYQNQRGYRVNQVRGLIALGLFKDYDDIRNSPTQEFGTYQPGDIKYKDVNGDGVVNSGDEVAIGATNRPNLIYGLGLSASYKNFDVNVHFQGAGKSSFMTLGKCVYAFSEGQWGNIFKGMLDNRWISSDISGDLATENPNASYPRLSYGANSNNFRNSTFWLRDGRYLRLKNVDIGYSLPKSVLAKLHMTKVRFYVTGTNLFFISKKFDTWDPESLQSRGEDYPITKAVTAGIQVEF
ncbi:MAG: SusC/RagA family TonB-linked outer membrane protein [Prevotella sp.]